MTVYLRNWDSTPRPIQHVQSSGHFWRREPPEFNSEGKISKGGMWDFQREWWGMDSFIKMLVAGFGGGKTAILCKRAIAAALHNAPVPVAVVSPTYPQAKLTTIPTLQSLLKGKQRLYGTSFSYRFVGQPPPYFKIRFRGRDATIYVLSAEKPEALKGSNLAGVYMDEAYMQSQNAFENLYARVRDINASNLEMCMVGTPEDLNWGYELAEGELHGKYDVGVVHASTEQNLALPEHYYRSLMAGFSELAALAYVKGHFTNMSVGRVYYAFDASEHVVSRKMPPGAIMGVGMDFNVDPMAAVVFWRLGTMMHVVAEIEIPNADTDFMCHTLRDKWSEDQLLECYPDATGQNRKTSAIGGISDHSIIKSHGFKLCCALTNPAIKDRYNAVNAKFRPADKSQPSLTVDPSCKRLIRYLTTYSHDKMNRSDFKAMSHLLDALGYPVARLWPASKNSMRMHKIGSQAAQ